MNRYRHYGNQKDIHFYTVLWLEKTHHHALSKHRSIFTLTLRVRTHSLTKCSLLQLARLLATRALAHRIAELRVLVLRLHLVVHLHNLLVPIGRTRLLGSVTLMSLVRLRAVLAGMLAGVTGHGSIESFDFNSTPKDICRMIL